jgi:hypothetical protein
MLMLDWLRHRFTSRRVRRQPPAKPARLLRFQLCLEQMEERVVPSTITVQNNADSGAGSLRAALLSANSGDTIDFAPAGLTGGQTIDLTSGSLSPTVNVTITDAGAPAVTIVDSTDRVFNFTNANLTKTTLQDLILQGAASDGNSGGAIRSAVGSNFELTVTDCTISNSSSTTAGGAIANNNGTLNLIGSTISGNTSDGIGGGLEVSSGTVDATNCTIAGNTANGAGGGGIGITGGILYLINCTISDNTGVGVGGLDVSGSTTTVDLINTIVAGDFDGSTSNYDIIQDGTATINAYTSLIQSEAFNTINGDDFFCLGGQSAMLNALANNGGPTQTMALQAGSPAIGSAGASGAPATDQRGYARPQGNVPDMGAFELRMNVAIISGNNQSAEAGTRFQAPLVIQVTSPDLNGAVVANEAITFSQVSNYGAGVIFIDSATELTNANGEVSVRVKANSAGGSYTISATLGSNSVQFSMFNESGYAAEAYNSAYYAYVYAYDAYVTTGNTYAYVAMNDAYSSFYYAYYAYYYNTVKDLANSQNCAYYAYYYAYCSAYYSSYFYNATGNLYSSYASSYADNAESESYYAALGY